MIIAFEEPASGGSQRSAAVRYLCRGQAGGFGAGFNRLSEWVRGGRTIIFGLDLGGPTSARGKASTIEAREQDRVPLPKRAFAG
jgi:hypothetical protein